MHTAIRRRNLHLAVLLLAVASCLRAKPFDAVAGGIATHSAAAAELPDEWRLDAISMAVPEPEGDQDRFAIGATHVLAWTVFQDDRPFTVEECLVLGVRGPWARPPLGAGVGLSAFRTWMAPKPRPIAGRGEGGQHVL